MSLFPSAKDPAAMDVNKQTIATGPVARYLDDPKKAAKATGKSAAYKPYTGLTSARVA